MYLQPQLTRKSSILSHVPQLENGPLRCGLWESAFADVPHLLRVLCRRSCYFQGETKYLPFQGDPAGDLADDLAGKPLAEALVLPPPSRLGQPLPEGTCLAPIFSVLATIAVPGPQECRWLISELCGPVFRLSHRPHPPASLSCHLGSWSFLCLSFSSAPRPSLCQGSLGQAPSICGLAKGRGIPLQTLAAWRGWPGRRAPPAPSSWHRGEQIVAVCNFDRPKLSFRLQAEQMCRRKPWPFWVFNSMSLSLSLTFKEGKL